MAATFPRESLILIKVCSGPIGTSKRPFLVGRGYPGRPMSWCSDGAELPRPCAAPCRDGDRLLRLCAAPCRDGDRLLRLCAAPCRDGAGLLRLCAAPCRDGAGLLRLCAASCRDGTRLPRSCKLRRTDGADSISADGFQVGLTNDRNPIRAIRLTRGFEFFMNQ